MEEVRKLRLEKGWNQTELAFYADLAPSVISLLETGKREPNATTLRKLAKALGVEIPDLFRRSEPPKGDAPSASGRPEGETVTVGSERTALWDVEELLINAMRRAREGEDERKIAREVARSIEDLRAS